jgi:hypothetical protein
VIGSNTSAMTHTARATFLRVFLIDMPSLDTGSARIPS